MKVVLTRIDDKVRFLAKANDNYVYIDGPPSMGGKEAGFRPMELLLSALASCASFDFASMLYKQGIEVEDILVEIEGQRKQEGSTNPFSCIEIVFILQGIASHVSKSLIDYLAKKAVYELCSVGATLRKETEIKYAIQYV